MDNTAKITYWHPVTRWLFRFWGVYFIIYFIFSFVTPLWQGLVNLLAPAFGIIGRVEPLSNGSGDGLFNYLQVAAMLLVAIIISMIWNIADRKRQSYNEAFYWVWTLVRYILALFMITYGVGKIYESQFPAPTLHRLVQPYGMSSPMGLAWTFMGASRPFSIFTGCSEALAGILLLFRPTVKFGAMMCISVMSVVVAMNFCYDIPVKLFSSHLLLAAVFVLSPEVPRLLKFLFTYKAIESPRMYMHPFRKVKWQHIMWIALKATLCLLITFYIITFNTEDNFYTSKEKVPLYGLYTAQWVIHNNDTIPARLDDSTRWRYLIMQYEEMATVRYMTDTAQRFEINVDTVQHTLLMKDDEERETLYKYNLIAPGKYILQNSKPNDTTVIVLYQNDLKKFLLINRGFHWINEVPFNR